MDTLRLLFKVNREALADKLKLLAEYQDGALHTGLISDTDRHEMMSKLENEVELCQAAIKRLAGMGISRVQIV